jgi:hypothetical protein
VGSNRPSGGFVARNEPESARPCGSTEIGAADRGTAVSHGGGGSDVRKAGPVIVGSRILEPPPRSNRVAGVEELRAALNSSRERRAPALWRGGEVQLDRLAAGAGARLDGDLSGTGLEDQRRGLLGAVDADPGAAHPAARAVATRLVRCQFEALAHHPRRWQRRGARSTGNLSSMSFAPSWRSCACLSPLGRQGARATVQPRPLTRRSTSRR